MNVVNHLFQDSCGIVISNKYVFVLCPVSGTEFLTLAVFRDESNKGVSCNMNEVIFRK